MRWRRGRIWICQNCGGPTEVQHYHCAACALRPPQHDYLARAARAIYERETGQPADAAAFLVWLVAEGGAADACTRRGIPVYPERAYPPRPWPPPRGIRREISRQRLIHRMLRDSLALRETEQLAALGYRVAPRLARRPRAGIL